MSNVMPFPAKKKVIKVSVSKKRLGTHEEYKKLISGIDQFQAFLDEFEDVYFQDKELTKKANNLFDGVAMAAWEIWAI